MKVKFEYPPNIKKIRKKFVLRPGVIYAYGDLLYNPSRNYIPPDVMVHEEVHSKQQGDDPKGWWKRYLSDPKFRLRQEVEAYHAQYKSLMRMRDRQERFRVFHKIASDLSSDLYGNLVDYQKAKLLIMKGVKEL